MQTLYLIRHTRPDIAPGICYGQLDIDVSDSFTSEAEVVLHWLPHVELIFTSPLKRTRKLAEHLTKSQHCELRSDVRLMEKHFGLWEGRAWNSIPHHEIDAWAADIMGHQIEGGESAQQLMHRTSAFLSDIAPLPHRHIAIVAHGGSIRALLAQLAAAPLPATLAWQIDYGAVIAVRLTPNSAIQPD